MKKILIPIIIVFMCFTLFACGGNDTNETTTEFDAQGFINDVIEEAEEIESFSEAAVDRYFKSIDGFSLDAVKPDWEYTVGNYSAYGDDPSSGYGHGVITFTKTAGELLEGEYEAWLNKVFNATAAASQDGYNIVGYEFAGDGEDALAETTLEDAVSGFMPGWAFRNNDKIYAVYVSKEYDNNKESAYGLLFYYDKVKIDVGAGLQKSFSDTMNDAEKYLEENEEAIKDAINDYLS